MGLPVGAVGEVEGLAGVVIFTLACLTLIGVTFHFAGKYFSENRIDARQPLDFADRANWQPQ
ncbi:MAG: hypothetical protein AAF823_16115, partial [Planctomycetota bacterium]